MTSREKKEVAVLFARSVLDLIVFFGIGFSAFASIGLAFAAIAALNYQPWFDKMFETTMDRFRAPRTFRARRLVYGVYFGSQWPSALWLWLYDHTLARKSLAEDLIEEDDKEKKP